MSHPSPNASPWWKPHVHADRRPFLLARNRIVAALRGFFAARDFVGVEVAALQISPGGNEAHLHAFATDIIAPDGGRSRLYLQTLGPVERRLPTRSSTMALPYLSRCKVRWKASSVYRGLRH